MRQPNPITMTVLPSHVLFCLARPVTALLVLPLAATFCAAPACAGQRSYSSANFVVTAATDAIARCIAAAAEESRSRFAAEWLDRELADWTTPVRIVVEQGDAGGDGSVIYERYRGSVENVHITLRGPLDRIVEYVLPHEVAHVVLAVSLRHPLPRWVDEGVALLSESQSQQVRQHKTVTQLMTSGSLMPLDEILRLEEYPHSHRELVGFYASSYSLTEYLVAQGGRQRLLQFVRDGGRLGWEKSLMQHYGGSLDELETSWREKIALSATDDVTRMARLDVPPP
jgi:hypothetical protein